MLNSKMRIPVIDLFAGPGGLSEGFSRDRSLGFKVVVSIEKDPTAHETLRLRAAHRALSGQPGVSARNWARWDEILHTAPWRQVFQQLSSCGDSLIEGACAEARREALNIELGPGNRELVRREIKERLAGFTADGRAPRNLVLIGGPPCQAYSVVGRSRNRGVPGYRAQDDHRHFLYLEYLHVIAEFEPAVFVMENVKGIISSRVEDAKIFHTILQDLKRPGVAAGVATEVEYVLCTLDNSVDEKTRDPGPDDFLIRAEEYGVPQARHRVIIVGVRKDVFDDAGGVTKLRHSKPPTVSDVIWDLPKLRPELSHRGKGLFWVDAFKDPLFDAAVRELKASRKAIGRQVAAKMMKIRKSLRARKFDPGSGSDRSKLKSQDRQGPTLMSDWFLERRTALLANHESRSHMPSDLVRYLFISVFGQLKKDSPRLSDFPKCLLPAHKNVDPEKLDKSPFNDRFRVQVRGQYAMTITSHIAKDGHAFIHPHPVQCRSLTVREAARLQTFPDSYVFLGQRTSQFTQVGNAVPPYLARQIAVIVRRTLSRSNATRELQQLKSASMLLAA